MRLLRDLSLSSRVLLLLELRRRPAAKLKPLAAGVGLTPQAVSGYLKSLAKEGLVQRRDGTWRVSPRGEEFLRSNLQEVKEFTDTAVGELVSVESCAAIAGARLSKGQAVGLFMEDGRLVAYPGRPSPSKGKAAQRASAGEDVLIEDLRGIVSIPRARLTLVELPAPQAGGSKACDIRAAAGSLSKAPGGAVAALDEVGEALLRRLELNPRIEFAPLESAAAAVRRGVSPTFAGSAPAVAGVVGAIEAARSEGRLRELEYEVVRTKLRKK